VVAREPDNVDYGGMTDKLRIWQEPEPIAQLETGGGGPIPVMLLTPEVALWAGPTSQEITPGDADAIPESWRVVAAPAEVTTAGVFVAPVVGLHERHTGTDGTVLVPIELDASRYELPSDVPHHGCSCTALDSEEQTRMINDLRTAVHRISQTPTEHRLNFVERDADAGRGNATNAIATVPGGSVGRRLPLPFKPDPDSRYINLKCILAPSTCKKIVIG